MRLEKTTWGHIVYQLDKLAWCVFVVLAAIAFAPIFAALKLREMWPARRQAA